jgi:PAS domain S-box-containing protein
VDRAGLIQDWNPAAARLFGWSRDEVVGLALADTIVPPALRSGHNLLRGYHLNRPTPPEAIPLPSAPPLLTAA